MYALVLARPTGFEPVTLGLEMRGIGYTNDIVLHRFVILQRVYENGLKTRFFNLRNMSIGRIIFFSILRLVSGTGFIALKTLH